MTARQRHTKGILEAHGLIKDYGGVRAIDHLDFAVRENELHCVIGPNGAGKSTFFKLLMGIERPTAGRIIHRDADITRLKPHERARRGLGVKFQNMRVFPELTVYQNLFIPLRRHTRFSGIYQAAEQVLAQVHMEGTGDVIVGNLSHGEQQWLAIAMSIAGQPEVLLLDEPTAGMGPDETALTAEIIQRLIKDGMTVIVIEHDMAFIRELAGHTSVLHHGSVFAEGEFDEIESNEEVQKIYLGHVAEKKKSAGASP